jgi:heme/copper-type cytochrome/quinol oxidase subunit 2
VFAVVALFWQAFNYNGGILCDIVAHLYGWDHRESITECTLGANARALIPFMMAFIIITTVVLLIHAVLTQERRMDRWARNTGQPLNRRLTTKTTWQGIWHIATFGLAWIPWYVYRLH